MSDEYQIYLKDQESDGIFEPQYRDMGKKWTYKYCDFLKNNVLKDFDYETARILDVGCREFFTYDYYIENFNNKIEGIDIGKKGLEYTAKENKPAIYCDAHKMRKTLEANQYDLVMSFHSYEHMYDLPKVLANCNYILKNEGYLYFAVPVPVKNEKRGHWFDIPRASVMKYFCKEAGFEQVFSKVFPKGVFRDEQEMVGLFKKQ